MIKRSKNRVCEGERWPFDLALLSAVLLIAGVAVAGPNINDTQLPPTYMPTGEQMFKQYCATCHGADARGNGPLAVMLEDACRPI